MNTNKDLGIARWKAASKKVWGRNKFLWIREPLGLPIYPQTGDGDNG